MSITATVKDGAIKLPEEVSLPDGTEVVIEVPQIKPFSERFAKYIGCIRSGIGDLSDNHEHYRLGVPKRKP